MARAVAQDDLEGVVGAGGEAGAVIGPVGEVADAQQELGPVGDAGGGQDGSAGFQQGRPVAEDKGAGVLVGVRDLEEGQQGVPDPELHGLVRRVVAVGQDVEPQHRGRRLCGGHQGRRRQQGDEQEQNDPCFHRFHGDPSFPLQCSPQATVPNLFLTGERFLDTLDIWKICMLH